MSKDEREYERYLAYCKLVGNSKPLNFEVWLKRRFYGDSIRNDNQYPSQEALYGGKNL